MGESDSEFTEGEIDLARRIVRGHHPLSSKELYELGLDAELLFDKYSRWIQPHLDTFEGYNNLRWLRQRGVETQEMWSDAVQKITGNLFIKCIRLSSHGISMCRDGVEICSILVFLSQYGTWISALSYEDKTAGCRKPNTFTSHDSLEEFYEWADDLIVTQGFDRFDTRGETFATKLAQLLDDLLDRSIAYRDEVTDDLKSAREGSRMQNVRFLGSPDYDDSHAVMRHF